LMRKGEISLALIEGNYPKVQYEHINYSSEKYIAVCSARHRFANGTPRKLRDLTSERLLIREKGSGTRNILVRTLEAKGISVSEFVRFMEVENMHTIIGLLEMDCGISFLYRIAAEKQIVDNLLKEIQLEDFQMEHDFDFIWEKGSIYTEKNIEFCKELIALK
ncbi:MAG: LysR family transcriptional regulator, partial [Clostridiales bacterium]|nr:LysR family transcriptional regulator [Clostridiales bacterium]